MQWSAALLILGFYLSSEWEPSFFVVAAERVAAEQDSGSLHSKELVKNSHLEVDPTGTLLDARSMSSTMRRHNFQGDYKGAVNEADIFHKGNTATQKSLSNVDFKGYSDSQAAKALNNTNSTNATNGTNDTGVIIRLDNDKNEGVQAFTQKQIKENWEVLTHMCVCPDKQKEYAECLGMTTQFLTPARNGTTIEKDGATTSTATTTVLIEPTPTAQSKEKASFAQLRSSWEADPESVVILMMAVQCDEDGNFTAGKTIWNETTITQKLLSNHIFMCDLMKAITYCRAASGCNSDMDKERCKSGAEAIELHLKPLDENSDTAEYKKCDVNSDDAMSMVFKWALLLVIAVQAWSQEY